MKKTILVLLLTLGFIQTNAQQNYDTVVYYPSELIGCDMSFDSTTWIWGSSTSVWGTSVFGGWYRIKQLNCYTAQYDSLGNIIPPDILEGVVISSNAYQPEAFAQPYHLDSNILICGVAVRAHGILPVGSTYGYYRFRLLDTNFNEIISTPITSSDTVMYNPKPNQCPIKNYYFGDYVSVKDFYLSADISKIKIDYGTAMTFNHSCSIYDTSACLDTIMGCQSSYSPLFMKDGKWIKFSEDSVYEMFQKTFIEFLPIILIPRNDSTGSLNKIELIDSINIYPNPSKGQVNIKSQFKIHDFEILDIKGVMQRKIVMNSIEKTIDISNLVPGLYIFKLKTSKGIISKTIILE